MADRPARLVTPGRVADAVAWVVVAGAAATVLTQAIGTPTGTVAAVQALTPWAVPPVLVVAIHATVNTKPRLGDSAAVVLAALLALLAPLVFGGRGPEAADGAPTTRVLTINVLYSNDDYDALGRLVEEADADVVAFAEVTGAIADGLARLPVADGYDHRVVQAGPGAAGLMLWSRLPLDDDGEIPGTSRSIDVTVESGDGPVRVVAMHPPPPVLGHSEWIHDLEAIDDIVVGDGLPTVVLGDFNASWFHPPFRAALADAGLRDALRAVGRPFAFSWPVDEPTPAFVTLDHVLVDDTFAVVEGDLLTADGSDHAAVVATIAPAAG